MSTAVLSKLLDELRAIRDTLPRGRARSAMNAACDRIDVAHSHFIEAEQAQAQAQAQREPDKLDAERWRFAMDWGQKDFAVCMRVGKTGVCWEPIKTDGPVDAARKAQA